MMRFDQLNTRRPQSNYEMVGPDFASGPAPYVAPAPLMAPPNLIGGTGAPGRSSGTSQALQGLGSALGGFINQRANTKAAGKMYDAPMPIKRPPFQQLGPPLPDYA